MDISAPMDWFKSNKINTDRLIFYFMIGVFFSLPIGTAPPLLCGVAATLVWIFSGNILKFKFFFYNSWTWPVFIMILLPWIGLLYTPEITEVSMKYAGKTHYWIYGLVIASLSFHLFPTQKLFQAFLLGLTLNAIVGIFQSTGFLQPVGHNFGLVSGYRALSSFIVVGILMMSYYFKNTKKKEIKLLSGMLILLFVYHLFIIKGRNGYFTFFILSPFLAYNLFNGIKIYKIVLLSALIILMIVLSPPFKEVFVKSKHQITSYSINDFNSSWGKKYNPKEERLYIFRSAIDVMMENPIIGAGTGGFYSLTKKLEKEVRHPHNNILYMGTSFGLVGVFVLLWLFWEVFKNSWNEKHTSLGWFVFSTTLVIFVSGIFNSQILDTGTAYLFSLAIGLQQGFTKFTEKSQKRWAQTYPMPSLKEA